MPSASITLTISYQVASSVFARNTPAYLATRTLNELFWPLADAR
jgi:hypothetical protein